MNFLAKLFSLLSVFAATGAQATAIPGQGTWETTLQARDLDGDTSNGAEAYYDIDLNITWLADASLMGTLPLYEANHRSFEVYGTTGWGVPSTPCGIYDCMELPYEDWYLAANFHHLFSITLGNSTENYNFESANTGPFLNVTKGLYAAPGPIAHCGGGGCTQAFDASVGHAILRFASSDEEVGIWLIHGGDIGQAMPVPEPSSLALGIIGALFFSAFHKNRRGQRPHH